DSAVSALLADELSRKSVPETSDDRPRPAELKVTPVIDSVDLPVSLKVSLSVSPFNRLTPLKDESCEVVLICASTLLYCATRFARVAGAWASATAAGPAPATALKAEPEAVAVPPIVPIEDDAASFDVVMLIL